MRSRFAGSPSRATWCALLMGAWVAIVSSSVQAAVLLPTTRVVFDGNRSDVSMTLGNDGPAERVTLWVDEGDPNQPPELSKAPFAVTPPLVRVDTNSQRPIRIARLANAKLPADRESMFWLNVRGIAEGGAKSTPGDQKMAVTIRSRIKLFYRPQGLAGDPAQAADALHWRWQQDGPDGAATLVISNPTPWHVSLNALQGQGQDLLAQLPAGTIAPLSETRLQLRGITPSPGQALPLQAQWIDDVGNPHPLQVSAQASP